MGEGYSVGYGIFKGVYDCKLKSKLDQKSEIYDFNQRFLSRYFFIRDFYQDTLLTRSFVRDYLSGYFIIRDFYQGTPFFVAAGRGHLKIVEFLLDNGALQNESIAAQNAPLRFKMNMHQCQKFWPLKAKVKILSNKNRK